MPFVTNVPAHVWPIAHANKRHDATDTVYNSTRIRKLERMSICPIIRHALGRAMQLDDASAIHPLTSHNSNGRTIDFLGLEGLICMAIALHGNQLAHPASARMIALAVQNKVDGFRCLRTNERVVQIRSRA
jgi:hypothetical protein